VKVVGLDLSLTGTGIAWIADNPMRAATYVYRTYPGDRSVTGRCHRIVGITDVIVPLCNGADMVALEGPSYHSNGGMAHERAGLWWAIVARLLAMGLPVASVPPTVRMLWATGHGRADKAQVYAAVASTFRGVALTDDNASDALVLAAMAGQRLGMLTFGGPHHVSAGRSVVWPR
jgi:Holliday junction resolvasome RuvABC endonuclease subunit